MASDPLDDHHGPGEEAPAPPADKLLVVDDESGIRKGCERVLRARGHEVFLAETAERGLEILDEHPDMDVALVDLRMPGMGGLEFLQHARTTVPEMVSVVITAYATLETAVEATRRDAFDFLTKPFTPDQLTNVVDKALGRARLVRERNRLRAEREMRLLELATEQSRMRTIINCMADAVLVCNAEHHLVLYNPAALRVLPGLNPGKPVARLAEVLEPPELLHTIEETGSTGKRLSKEIEMVHRREGGWALANVAPVVDEASGKVLGSVTVLRDITELKKVDQVKAQFVNMVAHELRSPLAAVDSYLSIMQQGLVEDPNKRRDVLSRSRDRLRALLDLVSDLLDVSRMEAGTVRREIAAQSLDEIVREVAELMGPYAAEKGVTIRVEMPPNLPLVEGDREEFVRLFNNLVSNGIKYNVANGAVTVTASHEGHFVEVAVTDTGVGISEEGLKSLFGEFFREKRPETRYATGTGLGLSIVKRIVEFYHGHVEVRSQLNQGSTFTVSLPCKHQTEPPATPEAGG